MQIRKKQNSVYGVGFNDADYATQPRINGKVGFCPFYAVWHNMLSRCYSAKYQTRGVIYAGCSVASEWHRFSVFKAWMAKQDWKGMQLEKDLLVEGNKIYSETTCCFVTSLTNNLLAANAKNRGRHPQGVSSYKKGESFRAMLKFYGVEKHLGYYRTPELAEEAYKAAKSAYIREVAFTQSNPMVRDALLLRADEMWPNKAPTQKKAFLSQHTPKTA